MRTHVTKPADVEHKWYVVNAEGKVLGRLASKIAAVLRGKNKPIFQPNVDAGDYVVVVNADKIVLTGFKANFKEYFMPSKFIGHSKNRSFKEMQVRRPELIVEKAVKGMLPHNPLGRKMGKKLFVYVGPEHKHQAQKPEPLEL